MSISVLICDDLPAVQSMLRRMLEREGLMVAAVASSAIEVLDQYDASHPDVVLLDYRMPGASGLSLLRDLLRRHPQARVVMCSGTADPEVQSKALAAGAVDWILKPVYGATLIARLRELATAAAPDGGAED